MNREELLDREVLEKLPVENEEELVSNAEGVTERREDVDWSYPDDVFLGASLYVASRLNDGKPLRVSEVADAIDVEEGYVLDCTRRISRDTDLQVPPPDSEDLVGRFCQELDLDERTREVALEMASMCEEVKDSDIAVMTSSGVAASTIYAAGKITGCNVTQAEVSDTVGVSEVTIRRWYPLVLEEFED